MHDGDLPHGPDRSLSGPAVLFLLLVTCAVCADVLWPDEEPSPPARSNDLHGFSPHE